MAETKSDILQGTLDLMVLKTLDAMGPLHGYGIARRIEQLSGEVMLVNQGTIMVANGGSLTLDSGPATTVGFSNTASGTVVVSNGSWLTVMRGASAAKALSTAISNATAPIRTGLG